MRKLSAFCVLLAAAGCGGGGSTLIQGQPPSGNATLEGYYLDSLLLIDQLDQSVPSEMAAFTAETAAPPSTVTFNGVMIVSETASVGGAYFGDLQVTADFSNTSLNGTASNFFYYDDLGPDRDGTDSPGSNFTLSVLPGGLVPEDPSTPGTESFPVVVTGSLNRLGSPLPLNAVSSSVDGGFAGSSSSSIDLFGAVGTTTFDDGSSGGLPLTTAIIGSR